MSTKPGACTGTSRAPPTKNNHLFEDLVLKVINERRVVLHNVFRHTRASDSAIISGSSGNDKIGIGEVLEVKKGFRCEAASLQNEAKVAGQVDVRVDLHAVARLSSQRRTTGCVSGRASKQVCESKTRCSGTRIIDLCHRNESTVLTRDNDVI